MSCWTTLTGEPDALKQLGECPDGTSELLRDKHAANVERARAAYRSGPKQITTEFLSNTSYLANYMTFHGTRLDFEALPDGRTRVTLAARYSRDLDPAWYFGPLQNAAVGEALTHVLKEFIDVQSNPV